MGVATLVEPQRDSTPLPMPARKQVLAAWELGQNEVEARVAGIPQERQVPRRVAEAAAAAAEQVLEPAVVRGLRAEGPQVEPRVQAQHRKQKQKLQEPAL